MTFADSGAGIPERIVKALLQDGTGSGEDAGVHIMGLRIVTQIIRAHGYKLLWKERAGGTYDVQIQMHEPQV